MIQWRYTDDDCVYVDRLVEHNFETQKRKKKYHGDTRINHYNTFRCLYDQKIQISSNITPTIKLYHYCSLKIDDNKPKWDITAAIQNHDYRPYCAHELTNQWWLNLAAPAAIQIRLVKRGDFNVWTSFPTRFTSPLERLKMWSYIWFRRNKNSRQVWTIFPDDNFLKLQ